MILGIAGLALTLLAGVLIGATGIGGVLLVPILLGVEGMTLSDAIAASALAFAFPGGLAIWRLRRSPTSARAPGDGLALWLMLGALPGAMLGAAWVHHVDTRVLLALLAAVALFSGVRGWIQRPVVNQASWVIAWPLAVLLGAAVGLGSGLTGTGGPVLLMPLLMALRQPLLGTIRSAQVIQLPVALSATLAHVHAGAMPLALVPLSGLLGLCLIGGFVLGQWGAERVATRHLQSFVHLLLVAVGLWFLWRTVTVV